jgi:hypothetical protein
MPAEGVPDRRRGATDQRFVQCSIVSTSVNVCGRAEPRVIDQPEEAGIARRLQSARSDVSTHGQHAGIPRVRARAVDKAGGDGEKLGSHGAGDDACPFAHDASDERVPTDEIVGSTAQQT